MNTIQRNEAEYCGKVPLHQTNLLQPHGYLLIVDPDFRIIQCGENTDELLGKPVDQIISSVLEDYLPSEEMLRLKARLEKTPQRRIPFLLKFRGHEHLATVKSTAGYCVFEVERPEASLQKDDSFLTVYQEVKYIMETIDEAPTTQAACEVAIRELKRLSGFDKIMMYRFDPEWNGDVIAEVKEEGMDAYLGLKFPASDIPRQARDLYKKTTYRLIPNVDYEPVKLYPVVNPVTNGFTDLSDSNLRSVAAVHLQYLRNMKVCASMSTRVLSNGVLWGLIACHHRTAKYLSFELCCVFELISNAVSSRIAAVQNADALQARNATNGLHNDLLESVYIAGGLRGLNQNLLSVLYADGAAVIDNGFIETIGRTPSEQQIDDLLLWLQGGGQTGNEIYVQTSLPAVYEPAVDFAPLASGLMVLPLEAETATYILAFRAEATEKISWGGNPEEALVFDADGKKYHPRASFGLWQQLVSNRAMPWTENELTVVENFYISLKRYLINKK